MNINKIFIYLSEKETLIKNDVKYLLKLGIFNEDEITNGNSLLICISRDYIDDENTTPAIRIRDQISNVFCPRWRCNAIKYTPFLSMMKHDAENLPELYFMTKNKEIYKDIDYYLNLSKFGNRYIALLTSTNKKPKFTEITSAIRRDDVLEEGIVITDLLQEANYGIDDQNMDYLQAPGFCFQVGSSWWTRIFNLYDFQPILANYVDLPNILELDRKELINLINNPILDDKFLVNEDLRSCIIEDQVTREKMFKYSLKTKVKLSKLDNL